LVCIARFRAKGIPKTQELKEKLTKEKIEIILHLKSILDSNPKYRKEIFSTDIYEAVLESDVIDINGFKKYLEKSGKSL